MVRHKIAVALLCGAGFTSILLLLLNVSSSGALSAFLTILLLPGDIPVNLVVRSKQLFGPPLFVLAANALVYSAFIYAGLSAFGRGLTVQKMRLAMIRLGLPVAILVGLACVPSFNPLWPRGMTELTSQERALQQALPIDIGLEEARTVLRSRGIQFHEGTETSQQVVLHREDRSITAAPGDRVISARIDTEAGQFPCGYAIQLILLFGPDRRLKDQYIHRLPLCP